MKSIVQRMLALAFLIGMLPLTLSAQVTNNPGAVTDLLERVTNASDKFVTVLDESLADGGKEVFVITASEGKPCIKGSSLSAITTGIGWYLNHNARINLAWNNLTTDLSGVSLPVPAGEEKHTCNADYRYYLNYCTFSYSMSTWTWERWQQEIDWMALHGINMPLQIIGLDVLWKNLLTEHYGYSLNEANDFIAGPCFQAWWGMNNLEGWGGPNPEWWYTRQEQLCKQILERERELGMQPVLPGYAGMVPSDFTAKTGNASNNQGNWGNFLRPYIIDPNSAAFADVSSKYYAELEELMGTSKYYSMDPFHEGANTSGIDVPAAYEKLAGAMEAANAEGQWVIQFWQWNGDQYHVLDKVEKGKLIILDLYSDAHTHFGEYKGHDAIYCMIPNFGGRTGFFGRLSKMLTEYFNEKGNHSNVKGVGATPEAIEQVPVLYDALYELPWRDAAPNPEEWTREYAQSRYGTFNADAAAAWEKLRTSSLACPTSLQGPMEAVLCGRPGWTVGSVSTWSSTSIFYDTQDVKQAAHLLLSSGLNGANYDYDLVDIARQALTDYGKTLLEGINEVKGDRTGATYTLRRDAYLQLILDIDELLNTNENFMLGRWTQMARGIADEVSGTTEADKDWLELDNARTLITTWGAEAQAQGGGLKDYSYREWGGMMKDYYYARWKKFFDNPDASHNWFEMEWAWAHNGDLSYSATPVGNSKNIAETMLKKYFVEVTPEGAERFYLDRHVNNDCLDFVVQAFRGSDITLPLALQVGDEFTFCIDFNGDGAFSEGEKTSASTFSIPQTSVAGKVKAQCTLSDGTTMNFRVVLKDEITEDRTVTVATADAAQGTAAIEGTSEASITNKEDVVLVATATSGYDFEKWTDVDDNTVSTDNPFTYYGKDAADFKAHFILNKWGVIEEDLSEWNTIGSYKQYVGTMTVEQNGGDPVTIYTQQVYPTNLLHTTSKITVAAGSQYKIAWQGAGTDGLNYCYLSAFLDLNGDGDFTDDGECVGQAGVKGNTNDFLNNSSLTVLLPYEIPQGITRMRLRFDGAWQVSSDLTPEGAKNPTAKTLRMVYDIPVEVVEYAQTACEVSVESSDLEKGTVDANGQSLTYTYGVGETVVLRAYPVDGYAVDYWTDKHNRRVPESWYDGNAIRFKASESGTYTVHFASNKTLTVGSWSLKYEDMPDGGIAIIGVNYGNGDLDLSAENSLGKSITQIAPGLFKNNLSLRTLTLPKELESMDRFLSTSFTGAGASNALITPERTIPAGQPWTLTLEGTSDGSSINKWGSGLLATGTDALANNYDGGFQLYLAKAGDLIVKVGTSENRFSNNLGSAFSIKVECDGVNKLTVTVTPQGGTPEVRTLTQTMKDITTFSSSIPAGVDITSLVIDDPRLGGHPFEGTTELRRIFVEEGSALFSDKEGILYDASGTVKLHVPARYGMIVDGWELNCEYNDAGEAIITGVSSGSGSLDFSKGNNVDAHIFSIRETVFQNNTALTALTLPAELNEYFSASQTGAGTESASLNLNKTIPAADGFVIDAEFEYSGSGFNEWGSVLLATGTNGFNGPFDNGFQLYLQTVGNGGGHLLVKYNGGTEQLLPTPITTAEKFGVTLEYDGNGHLTVVLKRANGTQEKIVLATTLNDITALCTCIKGGTNLSSLVISSTAPKQDFVKGCTNLESISVEAGCKTLEARAGVLFNRSDEMLVVPEGKPLPIEDGKYYRLINRVSGAYAAASTDGSTFVTLSSEEGAKAASSVFLMQGADDFTAKAQDLTSAALTPALGYVSKELVEYYTFAKGDDFLAVAKDAMWIVEPAEKVAVSIGSLTYTSAHYSFPVTMPEGVEAFVGTTLVDGVLTLEAANEVEANAGMILKGEEGTHELLVGAENGSSSSILGTNSAISDGLANYYIFGRKGTEVGFYTVPSSAQSIPANKAYLDRTTTPSVRLVFPGGVTGIDSVTGDEADETVYDISGRVVNAPVKSGIYVKAGKKVFVK